MTGLNLESFLHLLRADFGAWSTLGLIGVVLVLMTWTSWGSRRALRKCLVLSVIAHVSLALYGGTMPVVLLAIHPEGRDAAGVGRIRQIKVLPTASLSGEMGEAGGPRRGPGGERGGSAFAPWDRPLGGLAMADVKLTAPKTATASEAAVRPADRPDLGAEAAAPEARTPAPPKPEPRPREEAESQDKAPPPPRVTPGGDDDVAPAVVAARPAPAPADPTDARLRPEHLAATDPAGPVVTRRAEAPTALPETPGPAPTPTGSASLGPEPVAPRVEMGGLTDTAGEPAPPAAAEVAAKDVAAVDVVPARPSTPRLSAGESNLRARSRPGAGAGGSAPGRTPADRSALALALPVAAAPEGAVAPPPVPAATALAERAPAAVPASDDPRRPESIAGNPAPRPAALGAGEVAAPEVVKAPLSPLPRLAPAESDVRRRSRPQPMGGGAALADPDARRRPAATGPLALSRVTPSGVPALPEIRGATGGRPLSDVPEVYRSRLDPNRSAGAFRAGASPASEQAVERALDWLARHQDLDGRWDAATAKDSDGIALKGEDDFTVHCPPGETCFGECLYWEADTALTGLALLAYLGAGYTHTDGKYTETVGKGLDFLLSAQKADGDLRGRSRAVGMYCHAMATIALCEAYALTGDERLRPPVERAVAFLVRSRARDGLAWRYAPGSDGRALDAVGDTSILGWVVMALKSAREVGITVPGAVRAGTLGWLSKVSSGDAGGLAKYQPWDNVTPTMTAEAWVCRQFLGVGGPGPSGAEAADYLLLHDTDGGSHNYYYWYYGTLAMYQHGGDPWFRWNGRVRDAIVGRQRVRGHSSGSWDPDDSRYGARGGRVYCTALATLSLEVYYRYLRLYDEPKIPPAVAPSRPRPRSDDRGPAFGRFRGN